MIAGPVSGKFKRHRVSIVGKELLLSLHTVGAHLNPAVSISLMTVRKLKPVQCLFYIVGQVAGAFVGALLVYWLHWNLFNQFDGGVRHLVGVNGTADIFFTMPSAGVGEWNALFDQIVGTAILMIFIMALGQVRSFTAMSLSSFPYILSGIESNDLRSGKTIRFRSDHSRDHLSICSEHRCCDQSRT